jgi:MoaA/NifB/PqqE/SkfB family radical SAM enzyme
MIDHLQWSVARGEARVRNSRTVTIEDLAFIDNEYLEFNDRGKAAPRRAIHNRFYTLRREAFLKNEQPVPCVAGNTIAVVYDDGSVAPCELLPPVGNLREMTFEAIWNSKRMQEARESIASKKCACTHECFLHPSYTSFLLKRPFALMKVVGVGGLVQLFVEKSGFDILEKRGNNLAEGPHCRK